MNIRCLPPSPPLPSPTPTPEPTTFVDPCVLRCAPTSIKEAEKISNSGYDFPEDCHRFLGPLAEMGGRGGRYSGLYCYLALELGTDVDESPILTEEGGILLVSCDAESEEACCISPEESDLDCIEIEEGPFSIETKC